MTAESTQWFVGGDDILQEWHVVRKHPHGGLSAHEWVMSGNKVKLFTDKAKAQKVADKLN